MKKPKTSTLTIGAHCCEIGDMIWIGGRGWCVVEHASKTVLAVSRAPLWRVVWTDVCRAFWFVVNWFRGAP